MLGKQTNFRKHKTHKTISKKAIKQTKPKFFFLLVKVLFVSIDTICK